MVFSKDWYKTHEHPRGTLGKKLSEDHRKRISEANKGKVLSDWHRQRISEANKGKPRSEETKRKLSLAQKGRSKVEKVKVICPCGFIFFLTPGRIRGKHGKYHTRDCYFKYRDNEFIGRLSREKKGDGHPNWKGDDVGYAGLHLWVQQQKGKATICEDCNSIENVEWANISKQYLRDHFF